ncbi:MAG: PIN domain-containing protein [Ignisphaera sp.]
MGPHKDVVDTIFSNFCLAILDTSILFLVAQNLVKLNDIFIFSEGCNLVVPIHVVNELNKLSAKSTEKGRLALWILRNLLGSFQIIEVNLEKCKPSEADCAIIELSKTFSKDTKLIVLTADSKLRKELIKYGVEVVWYRKAKNKLESTALF